MKNFKLFIGSILIILVASFYGCNNIITNEDGDWGSDRNTIHGSGRLETISKNYSGFDEINLSHSFKAKVYKSENYYISIKLDDNLLKYLETSKSGRRISLGLNNNYNYNDVELIAEIGLPDITTIDLSGACEIELYGFNFTHSINVYLSGASSVMGEIYTGDISLYMSGASNVNLIGEGKNLDIYGSGASNVELTNFTVDNADINLSGASCSKVRVNNNMKVHLTGASILYYLGNPTITQLSVEGVSKIIKY